METTKKGATVSIREMTLNFAPELVADAIESLKQLLAQEPIIEVISDPHYAEPFQKRKDDCASSFYGAPIYLITELGTFIGLWYDFRKQSVVKIHTSEFLKKLVCYKIKRLQAT